MEVSHTLNLGEASITMSTGKLATLAAGSVLLQSGGTTVLATVTVDKKETEQDFFPLSVEYIEKMYARGAISGSRFMKREGYPSDEAIIKARQVDHSIRSLFPKGFKKPVGVILTVLSYDEVNDPEILAVMGASAAIMLSGAPYFGPSASVVAGITESGEIKLNPKVADHHDLIAEFLISGVTGKLLNIEGWGKEVTEEQMDKVIDASLEMIEKLNNFQIEFVTKVKGEYKVPEKDDSLELPAPKELIEFIKADHKDALKKGLFVSEKMDRNQNLADVRDAVEKAMEEKEWKLGDKSISKMEVFMAVDYVARKILRDGVLEEEKRVSGRKLDEIRPLLSEIDLLPTVHGSALFSRGLTQSLSIVTLSSQGNGQMLDDMEGESTKTFMHHYNFPPFSTGEAGRYNYKPGRREVGHGAIGENALKHMVPSQEVFPYTIRVVSEIMTSNGSTSMAATCASSMALMAAGVPLKEQVAGIGVGLVTKDGNEDEYKLLMDIEGIEDFYGDMDFKVTGTKNGITAIQYENKLRGVKPEIIKEAFRLSKSGRAQVLEVMNSAIAQPKGQLAPNAPIVEIVSIKPDRIGELIGPGGKSIKDLVARAEEFSGGKKVDININDEGKVTITASDSKQLEFVKGEIAARFEEAEIGKEYSGIVDKIAAYGFFVDISNSISGLTHVSEIVKGLRNLDVTKVLREGDRVNVKVTKVQDDGKISFTMIGVAQDPKIQEKIDALTPKK